MKKAIVLEYLDKYPESGSITLSKKILEERGVKINSRTIRRYRELRDERSSNLNSIIKDYNISPRDITVNEWTVTSFKNGKPVTATNTQIKVKGNVTKEFNFEDHLKKYQAPKSKAFYHPTSNIAVINIYDAHIDKLAFTSSNSIEDNLNSFIESFNNLLNSTLWYNPETIVFPVGSDFFNSNGLSSLTKKGTPQDNSVKPHIAFDLGLTAIRKCIDLAKLSTNIYIPIIQGNHDEDTCFYLGKCLEFIYEFDDRVQIDSTYTKRKYFSYNDILIGFAHGSIEKKMIDKLPLVMAEEQKALWASSSHRFWYLGDIHHKQEYKFLRSKDYVGCEVNFLRSISELDQWHHDSGYIGIPKSAEASIFSTNKGEVAKFKVNL